MRRVVSPRLAVRRNALAALLRRLRLIARNGPQGVPPLDRLTSAIADAGSVGRLVTIVLRRSGTAGGTVKVSFAINKGMLSAPETHDHRAYSFFGMRDSWVFAIDDRESMAQGAD
jgi:hypothetical protein